VSSNAYDFVLRGLLTEEALDRAGRQARQIVDQPLAEIATALNYDLLDPDELAVSSRMAAVYAAITAFERSARRFVAKVLQSECGDQWWEEAVSDRIRRAAEARREEENAVKWHGTRGEAPLTYTELGQLVDIIQQNWAEFEPHVRRIDWARSIFGTIERSRNVIMHSGTLDLEDIERVGMNIRDWVKQVGA
jgi:hypothetical protein